MKKRISHFYNQHKLEFIFLLMILVLASVLRFYKIGEYMTFLGDEGRDAIIVRRLLVDFDPILIGPGTSIGNMYIGPLYYYLIALPLLFFNFSPIGPSIFVAALGVVTTWFIWFVAREFFAEGKYGGGIAGLIAAGLYAISPTVIIYSRSSWNPNVMPFFSLLAVWSIWRVWKSRQYQFLVVAAIAVAFALQSHWLALLMFPTLGIFWLAGFLEARFLKRSFVYLRYTGLAALAFLLLMSPLFIFDLRHDWLNFKAMKTFFTVRQTTVSARPWTALPDLWPMWQEVTTRLLTGRAEVIGGYFALITLVVLLWLAGMTKRIKLHPREKSAFWLLVFWIGFGLLGLGVYKQHVYDHYFGFFFAAPFLLFGGISEHIIEEYKLRGTWLVATALLFLGYFNLKNSPLRWGPNKQLQRTEAVAQKIADESEGKFNLAVIAERNYEDAYQYFLEKWGTGVTDIDPLNSEATITEELFVVCEMPLEKCDPTHNSKAEVANFGWSKIDDTWEVWGVTIFKLVHTEGENSEQE